MEKLNEMATLPVKYIKHALELVFFTAAMIIIYCVILDSRGNISPSDSKIIYESLGYIASSVCLSLSFGLLLDLYLKNR